MSQRQPIKVVKKALKRVTRLSDPIFSYLATDPRKGIRRIMRTRQRSLIRQQRLVHSFKQRLIYEHRLHRLGYRFVAGIDEVGRGPLAGPVVTCAVILPKDFDLVRVNDSKQLTPHEREALYLQILDRAVDFSIGIGSRQLIDRINIYQADREAMRRAVQSLNCRPDYLIVDAMQINVPIPQLKLYHGDARSVSVGAASIVAKVYRDHWMNKYGHLYPQYDFKHNAGYGTREHLRALKKYGATPIHRRSFSPVKRFLK